MSTITTLNDAISANSFRTQANTNFANLNSTKKEDSITTNKLLGRSTAGTWVIEEIVLGTGLSYTGNTLNVTAGAGDMILASAQTNSALKTFLNGTFGIRNIANTITSLFSSAATVARTHTLQDRSGTLADDTDLALKANLASPTFTGTVVTSWVFQTTDGNWFSIVTNWWITLNTPANAAIYDAIWGNEYLRFAKATTAVNELTITNAATWTWPILSATGWDANIDINIVAKWTGRIRANATSFTTTGNIELGHDTDTTLARNAAWVISVEWEVMNGYTTTATAVGITTLTIASNKTQYFTGVTTQTVRLPTTSVIVGQPYIITNLSTGLVTVQSSGINTIVTLGLNQTVVCTAIVATPTTAGNWTYVKSNLSGNANGKRILIVTQSATPATNTDNGDIVQITGLTLAITSMSSGLTGTPVAGDMIMFQITDNATARAITWWASFASTTVTLPTTTVISTMLRVWFQRNNANTIWDCIAVA